jgi:hypothetical protein
VTGAYWGDDSDPQGQTDGPCVTTGEIDAPLDWTVKFGNQEVEKEPVPVPAMGPLGLLVSALGLGLMAGWRARRQR